MNRERGQLVNEADAILWALSEADNAARAHAYARRLNIREGVQAVLCPHLPLLHANVCLTSQPHNLTIPFTHDKVQS